MADNVNRRNCLSSGRPSRRNGPATLRFQDYIEGLTTQSSRRSRSDRSQEMSSNRSRFDKTFNSNNGRSRFDRQPNVRTHIDRNATDNGHGIHPNYSNSSNINFTSTELSAINGNERSNVYPQHMIELNHDNPIVNSIISNDTMNPVQNVATSVRTNNNVLEIPNWNAQQTSITPNYEEPKWQDPAPRTTPLTEIDLQFKTGPTINNQSCDTIMDDSFENSLFLSFPSQGPPEITAASFLENGGLLPPPLPIIPEFGPFNEPYHRPICTITGISPFPETPSNLSLFSNNFAMPCSSLQTDSYSRIHSLTSTSTGEAPCAVVKRNYNNANGFDGKLDLPHTVTSGALDEEWVNAPEFYPKNIKPKSYAEAVNTKTVKHEIPNISTTICPMLEKAGVCRMLPNCSYLHGDKCELCGIAALHPTNQEQRKQHQQKCSAQHQKDMEISSAIARSKEKTCGICFEVVLEKDTHERRFGILTKCNHCFCLACIRKWRQARQFENKVVRACPECRVTSDFVCPSLYWVETKEDKDKLIDDYKNALAAKECKYFKQGRGSCPFGNKCFYLHALPDGTKTDVGPPPRRRRNRNRQEEGELGDMLQQIILWDFLDEHDHHWLYSFADDLEELVSFFSDSDESEWSEYEYFLD